MKIERKVILHGHMFKNAGTTLDWSLRRNFGANFLDHRDDPAMRSRQDCLKILVEGNPAIQAISSHSLPIPVTSVADVRFYTIVLMRNPLDRVLSAYSFEKRQKANTPGALNAKKKSFKEYVEWRMRPEVGATIRNFHTYFLTSNHQYTSTFLPERLDIAKAFIEQSPLVGLVERYEDSMILFENYLKESFGDIDLSFSIQNVGEDKRDDGASVMEFLESKLDASLMKKLLQNNRFDLELYDYAKNVFQNRIDSVNGYEHKLLSLKQRCKNVLQSV